MFRTAERVVSRQAPNAQYIGNLDKAEERNVSVLVGNRIQNLRSTTP
jgi:hypothetical protein